MLSRELIRRFPGWKKYAPNTSVELNPQVFIIPPAMFFSKHLVTKPRDFGMVFTR